MSYPIQRKDIIWRRVGDTIIVIREDGLSSHILNKTAAYIWELCDGTLDTSDIADRMHERFDVSLELAESDAEKIIKELTRAGIMNTAKGTRHRTR
jgi:hypothetical protein